MLRVHGEMKKVQLPVMEEKQVHEMLYDIMNDVQRKVFEENLECDFSFEVPNVARFRVNAYKQNRGTAAVFRTIPSKVLTLEQLNAPKIFADLMSKPKGLILVTGPTGSGKSTTLAAIIDHYNENETGHLVLGTLHSSSAAKTINRIIDVFPEAEKDMVRTMLSESIEAIISQSLLKTKDGLGRVAAHEIMIGTPAIRNLIRENKIAQMYSSIQTGQTQGMQTMDQCLQRLVKENKISLAEAKIMAVHSGNF
jgi:twitching motility protein PilT